MSKDDSNQNMSKKFQVLSCNHILKQLKPGKRFLVADEVGLGKTIIAREVVKEVLDPKNGSQPESKNIFYICSSLSIAEQNYKNLIPEKYLPEKDEASDIEHVSRLSMIPVIKKEKPDDPLILALTPGTSFKTSKNTGKLEERALIYAIIAQAFKWRIAPDKDTRTLFFAHGANSHTDSSFWKEYKYYRTGIKYDEFPLLKNVKKYFIDELKEDPIIKAGIQKYGGLYNFIWQIQCLEEKYKKNRNPNKKEREKLEANFPGVPRRSEVIGILKTILSRVAIRDVKPCLIIMDEFQNFYNLLTDSDIEGTLENQVMNHSSARILLLSATPYKSFTTTLQDLSGGDSSHLEELRKTLDFLTKKKGKPIIDKLQNYLSTLKPDIDHLAMTEARFTEKQSIENAFKSHMLRTERYPFYGHFGDHSEGTQVVKFDEYSREKLDPSHLKEYFLIQKKANDKGFPLDYWKSGDHVLSFLKSYKGVSHLYEKKAAHPEIDKQLYLTDELLNKKNRQEIPIRNKRLKLIVNDYIISREAHKHLWMPPTLTSNEQSPEKLLIFSHWKFIPEMISSIVSHQVEYFIDKEEKSFKKKDRIEKPIKLVPKGSNVMSRFYPSLFLALIESQLDVKEELAKLDVKISKKPQFKLDVLLRAIDLLYLKKEGCELISENDYADAWEEASLGGKGRKSSDENEQFKASKAILDDCEFETLSITEEQLQELIHLHKYGIGVLCLRALIESNLWDRAKKDTNYENYLAAIRLSYLGFRSFFQRHLNQRIVNIAIENPEQKFTTGLSRYLFKLEQYCEKFQFYDMLVEYLFVLGDKVTKPTLLQIAHDIESAILIGRNSTQITILYKNSNRLKKDFPMPLHIARRFGQIATDKKDSTSKENIRSSFNSPFWPFVLATTSVGQEGLDFHLYCRNIVHWNFTSNPVNFEQREGRINRYNCLAIRKALVSICKNKISWAELMQTSKASHVGEIPKILEVFPNWVVKNAQIRRHIVTQHPLSQECARYEKLLNYLATYRLAMGHPRQEEFISSLIDQNEDHSKFKELTRSFMLNLMPFNQKNCIELLTAEAQVILSSDEREKVKTLSKITSGINNLLSKDPNLKKKFGKKIKLALDHIETKESLVALLYFLNPLDGIPDYIPGIGFNDDDQILDLVISNLNKNVA